MTLNEGDLAVWWVRNPPRKAERYPVPHLEAAAAKLLELTKRDLANSSVFANAGGLNIFENGEWVTWYDENGNDIDDLVNHPMTEVRGLCLDGSRRENHKEKGGNRMIKYKFTIEREFDEEGEGELSSAEAEELAIEHLEQYLSDWEGSGDSITEFGKLEVEIAKA